MWVGVGGGKGPGFFSCVIHGDGLTILDMHLLLGLIKFHQPPISCLGAAGPSCLNADPRMSAAMHLWPPRSWKKITSRRVRHPSSREDRGSDDSPVSCEGLGKRGARSACRWKMAEAVSSHTLFFSSLSLPTLLCLRGRRAGG